MCCLLNYKGLLQLTTSLLNQGLSGVIQLQLVDDNLGWVDVDRDGGTTGLLLGQLLELDGELQSVHGADLALRALLGASDNSDLVLLSDWQGSDLVLLSQLLGQRSRHQHSSGGRRGGEVSLSVFRTRRGNVC